MMKENILNKKNGDLIRTIADQIESGEISSCALVCSKSNGDPFFTVMNGDGCGSIEIIGLLEKLKMFIHETE